MKEVIINYGKIDLIPYIYIEGGEKYLESFGNINTPYVQAINDKLNMGGFTEFAHISNYTNSFDVQGSRRWEIASKYFKVVGS